MNLFVSAVFAVAEPHFFRDPPNALLEALAGVGGAVFIAYTVAMTDLFRGISRDSESQFFIGFLVGLGLSGVAGVCIALVLLEVGEPFGWLGHLALFWSASSVAFLGFLVAAVPLFAYERARAKHLNPDD